MTALFDGSGRKITLGSKIGTGGEGSVYDVVNFNGRSISSSNLVAKIYHSTISPEKQAKLQCMVSGQGDQLKKLAAWPLATVHTKNGGPVHGFLMPKATGAEAVHHLYSPAQRKQEHPEASWAFLVSVARNVAAAFVAIHSHGHVIGDVNPNLVFVSRDSTVKLIDSDSFQISGNGKHYLCEVGVPHFTPPELQETSSFHGVRRSPNHDNFGLALLLFHILLMGRHPFAGVYSGSGDLPLEKSIAEFRYAYSRNAASKKMQPPPNSVTPSILPTNLATLFERAFTEAGAHSSGRPSARDWLPALESLRTHLRTCGQDSIHKFSASLSICPWCTQENQFNVCFFISAVPTGSQTAFNFNQVWVRITAVQPPKSVRPFSHTSFSVQPRPLPPELRSAKQASLVKKIIAVVLVLGSFAVAQPFIIFALIIGGFLFFSGEVDSSERRARQAALNNAQEEFSKLNERWKNEAGDGKFKEKVKELALIKSSYEGLANQFAQEKQKLQQNLREDQLRKFLSKALIADHNIPRIGPTRQATLASFGIETAADLSWQSVIRIKGFGKTYTSKLVNWRKSIERRFRFDPSKGIDPADLAQIQKQYTQKQKQLQGAFLAGPEQLMSIKQVCQKQRQSLPALITAAAERVAQAKADMSML